MVRTTSRIHILSDKHVDGNGCDAVCIRYKGSKSKTGGRYDNGQKRCKICDIFIRYEGLWCPCCGYRLRTKPRNKLLKSRFKEKTGKEFEGY